MTQFRNNIVEMRYSSTNSFVFQNGLEKEAVECFGTGWEAEDDVNQIEQLLEFINARFYDVEFIEECSSEEDIEVSFNSDKQEVYDLKNNVEKAKELLEKNGYIIDWNISDVKNNYSCTDKQAREVLETSLKEEYIVSEIRDSIRNNAEAKGLTEK